MPTFDVRGRCQRCRVVFEWALRVMAMERAHCPDCGRKLWPTSRTCKDPLRREVPTLVAP